MKAVRIGELCIGQGAPKICVPITGITEQAILKQAEEAKMSGADLIEWRVDWYENALEFRSVEGVLAALNRQLGDFPLLFTFRSKKEGGVKEISQQQYKELLVGVAAASGLIALADVEAFSFDSSAPLNWGKSAAANMGYNPAGEIIEQLKFYGVRAVASNHDFEKTPAREAMIGRLIKMQDMGADILKIAVMPHSREDVLSLMAASAEMYELWADRPIVAIAMGRLGLISRLAGECFGSSITFGSVKKASAPGQMEAETLRAVIDIIHSNSM